MAPATQISDAEWNVMEVVWAAGDCSAADVISRLAPEHNWNHRTIRTLLARLVEKGALQYEVDGARYIYRAAVSREQCVRDESRSFVQKIFHGDVGTLLAHFVASAPLDNEEIERLRRLLDDKKSRKGKKR
jgi:BlaI family penicillinase repressor